MAKNIASSNVPAQSRRRGPGRVPVRLTVNGESHEVWVEPRRTLLDVLRKDLGLSGTKKVCDRGQCGACTVLLDGVPVYSCLKLAIECEGVRVETIEGLADAHHRASTLEGHEGLALGESLHPLQRAFVEHDAFQCGFCTPGQIMSLKALFDRNPRPTVDEIKNAVAGNLCRCGAYPKILRAALSVAEANRQE